MGTPQIEVTFDIDANGIVNVEARDKGTGKEQKIVIQSSGGLSKEQIEQMIQDAQDNAAKDAARREAIEARNEADSAINMLEKNLEEYKDQLEADQVEGLRKNIAETRDIVKNEDSSTEEIEKAVGDEGGLDEDLRNGC